MILWGGIQMSMPVLFVGHGSPMNAIESNQFSREWQELGRKIPRPKAVLSISAHWYTDGLRTSDLTHPQLVYDMYGFPEQLYALKYPVEGSVELANSLKNTFPNALIIDNNWGIDHGTWSVMKHMFPNADVPVVQLSIDSRYTLEEHFKLGQVLKKFRDEEILIMGSGNVVHNLAKIRWDLDKGFDWAYEFDEYIKKHVIERNFEHVIQYKHAGESSKSAFYTLEHFIPLLYVLGCSDEKDQVEVFNNACIMGSMSMTGYRFY